MAPKAGHHAITKRGAATPFALPRDILAVAGESSLIERVSDTLNGIIAKKDAIR
jgi:hypothetical protein